MFIDSSKRITHLRQAFLQPANSTQRQYEALRAYFVEGLCGAEVAARFGYTPGSFRVLVHHFRQNPKRPFFLSPAKGPQASPKSDPLREKVIALLRHPPNPPEGRARHQSGEHLDHLEGGRLRPAPQTA